jgi:uncharacterized protein YbjT (DUF2867 family)
MLPTKTYFVTGATGNQGGAVIKHLLKNGFRVKALTRDPDSVKSKGLAASGADIIEGDLNTPSSYNNHLKDVDGVFCVLTMKDGAKKELQQGLSFAQEVKKSGSPHFLYSSVIGADLGTGIPHWESKNQIEGYIKRIGLSYTIIRPASLYENLFIPQVRSRILKGKLVFPVQKNKLQQYIGAHDVGRISTTIFMNPSGYLSKTVSLAVEEMDGEQLAGLLSKIMNRPMKYEKLPGIITRIAMGKNLYKMFSWINANDEKFIKDIDAIRNEFPGFLSFEDWIKTSFHS